MNAINMPNVTAEEAPILVPYMALASRLGSFLGQVTRNELKAVSIELDGAAAGLNSDPIIASCLAGLMAPVMAAANMVNAASLAQSRGINVSSVRHDRPCDYQTMIRVTITYREPDGDEVSRTIAGTLVGGSMPRIIEAQGIGVESDFPQNLLYLRNYDKPGFIGDLGSLCGKRGINIATFHLGRREVGEAIALVEIDVPDQGFIDDQTLPQVVRADTSIWVKSRKICLNHCRKRGCGVGKGSNSQLNQLPAAPMMGL